MVTEYGALSPILGPDVYSKLLRTSTTLFNFLSVFVVHSAKVNLITPVGLLFFIVIHRHFLMLNKILLLVLFPFENWHRIDGFA